MQKLWPIFFLTTLILFQVYVSVWNKNQSTSLANNHTAVTTKPIKATPTPTECTTSFSYPNTSVKENHTKNIFMETPDGLSQVLQWYTNQLATQNFYITSNVESTTNGTSSYMLVGQKDTQEITIVVGRSESESATTIFIHHNFCT